MSRSMRWGSRSILLFETNFMFSKYPIVRDVKKPDDCHEVRDEGLCYLLKSRNCFQGTKKAYLGQIIAV